MNTISKTAWILNNGEIIIIGSTIKIQTIINNIEQCFYGKIHFLGWNHLEITHDNNLKIIKLMDIREIKKINT